MLSAWVGVAGRTKKANLNIPVALNIEGIVPSGGRRKFRGKCTGRKKTEVGCQAKMKPFSNLKFQFVPKNRVGRAAVELL